MASKLTKNCAFSTFGSCELKSVVSTDEKFCDAAMKFDLLKDTEDKYFTIEEYKELIAPSQTDKDGNIIFLYATDKTAQYTYIKAATDRGYSVLVMDGQLDMSGISP